MASTAIPAVKAKILEVLEAAEGLADSGVLVTADKEPERAEQYVWLYRKKATRDFKVVGQQPAPLDETVRVFLRILVVKGSGEAAPSEERALEIAEIVETALREAAREKALGKNVRNVLVEELDDEQLVFDQKRGCHVLMTVALIARI